MGARAHPVRHWHSRVAPGWLCPGCATEVALDALPIPADAGGPCHRCGSALRWEFDRVTGLSSWSCTAGCTGPAAPLDAPPLPAPAPHAATHLPDAPAGTQQGPSRPAAAFWLTRGPPRGLVAWLYVPLLHAAAADLAPSALESWRADPRASVWWEQARQLLATSAPVAPQTLIAALARTAETAPENAHHLPDLVARIHDAGLPNGSLVHAGWAVRQLREPDGYLLFAGAGSSSRMLRWPCPRISARPSLGPLPSRPRAIVCSSAG